MVDHTVVTVVGPEVIAGSTRMKAGTAQKLVLNTISTVTMVRLGRTYGNLMVDVVASNSKLRARARRAVELATEVSDEEIDAALFAADGDTKVAIVSLLAGVDAQTARRRLDAAGGAIRAALEARRSAMRLGVEAAVVDGLLLRGDVEIVDGRIAAVGVNGSPGRGIAIPGLVDLQVNGIGGVDFASADLAGYRRAGEALLECGVTAFQPTLITAPEADLVAALAEVPREEIGPRVIGAHLEGPFLSPKRLGAHPASAQRDPDAALLARLLDAGPVSTMTLAPELDGALELIDALTERGVVVSCGHSDATAEEAGRAFDRGAVTVTHLFNAMRPLQHRDPGIAGAALARDDVIVQMILDGHHLADETARVVWRAAAGRVALVSDAIAAARMGDGAFRLGNGRRRGARRRRAATGRRPRGERADADRGGAGAARAGRPAGGRSRGRDHRAGADRAPTVARHAAAGCRRRRRRARRRAGDPDGPRRRPGPGGGVTWPRS